MPASGRSVTRSWTEEEQRKITRLGAARSLTPADALALLGENCVDVYLNGDAMWLAVPVNVWEYTLGGYQVLKKWLSYREFDLLGRALHADEAAYFAQVVRRISAILLMEPELDASYEAILPDAVGLPPSSIPRKSAASRICAPHLWRDRTEFFSGPFQAWRKRLPRTIVNMLALRKCAKLARFASYMSPVFMGIRT